MIAVECRAWAENIQHDRMERRGLAHFEVTPDYSRYLDMLYGASNIGPLEGL